MTATRRLVLAAVAALPLALAACDNKCPTQNPKIASGGVPTCTGGAALQAGAPVTVKIGVCPRCDESYDTCTVTLPDQTSSQIQLDPLVQVCNADPSCPLPPSSCSAVSCTFTAPAAGNYTVIVFDPTTSSTLEQQLTTVAAGGQTSCGG
jgi:hypothetical protein